MRNKDLKRRILDISYRHRLSHIGSCISAVDIIADIYAKATPRDIFILSNGHAGLAQYVCLEKYHGLDAEKLLEKHGIHPNYSPEEHIYASTGSLGHGIGIAVGYAIANTSRQVVCMISDGEMAEGSVYEALCIADDSGMDNLSVVINANGYGAYRRIYPYKLSRLTLNFKNIHLRIFNTANEDFPFLEGLSAHYKTLTESEYKLGMKMTHA